MIVNKNVNKTATNDTTSQWLLLQQTNRQSGKSLLQKAWYIQYYFHDPKFREDPKYKYGKRVIIKGMNKFKTLGERRAATAKLIENELALLRNDGYNPITLKRIVTPASMASDISEGTPLCKALELAKSKVVCERHTREDIDSMLRYFNEAAIALQLDSMPVGEVRQKHIKLILEQCGKMKASFSGHRFNKYRSYLMILFKELVQLESMAAIDTFTPLEKGLYIAESTFKEKMSGPFKGKTDEAIRHRTTITLSVRSY